MQLWCMLCQCKGNSCVFNVRHTISLFLFSPSLCYCLQSLAHSSPSSARVGPSVPRQERPAREGARVASIETGLAAAAAKLSHQVNITISHPSVIIPTIPRSYISSHLLFPITVFFFFSSSTVISLTRCAQCIHNDSTI